MALEIEPLFPFVSCAGLCGEAWSLLETLVREIRQCSNEL